MLIFKIRLNILLGPYAPVSKIPYAKIRQRKPKPIDERLQLRSNNRIITPANDQEFIREG